MIGWPVAWKCFVACLLGESSQQPTCPQVRQIRKCSHTLPLFRHSSQPSALGVTLGVPLRWVQPFAILNPHRYSAGFAVSPRKPCNAATTCAPSPIAPPTRLTDPERTSPTANTPGTEGSSADAICPSLLLHCAPVSTNPPRSTMRPQPWSQLVAGSAPTNRNRLRISALASSPDKRLRQRTRSREMPSVPSSATTSVLNISSIFGVAS